MHRPTSLFLGVAVSALAAGALAQTAPDPLPAPELSVVEAFQELRASPTLALTLDATETYLGRSVVTKSTIRWQNAIESGRDVVRVQILVSVDRRLTQWVVCDGTTVWSYDTRRNRYSALPVDRATGTQASTYRLYVEGALSEAVGGPAADIVHMAREIAGGTAATHRAWIPGVRAVRGDQPWQGRWAIYDLPTGQPKQVTFEIDDVDGEARFSRLHRTGSTRLGRDWRTLEETIILNNDPIPANTFVFTPPRNAVSVPARAVKF